MLNKTVCIVGLGYVGLPLLCLSMEKDIKVVIDGKNCLDKEKIKSLGIVYKSIGKF